MSELAELNNAVLSLNELSLVCAKSHKEEILRKRDALDAQAAVLANRTLKEGSPELSEAIKALNELTKAAAKSQEEIEKLGKSIVKITEIIDMATTAVTKVATVLS